MSVLSWSVRKRVEQLLRATVSPNRFPPASVGDFARYIAFLIVIAPRIWPTV
jgi:hypothetical protein